MTSPNLILFPDTNSLLLLASQSSGVALLAARRNCPPPMTTTPRLGDDGIMGGIPFVALVVKD
jgi:hypothetical protein